MKDTTIIIKVFPAINGDSILIELSEKLFLIDGGFVNTFNEYLFDELINKSKKGRNISHLIVTHIDSDHISGIIKLLENNTNNKIISINNIWHNSYRHIKDIDIKLNIKKNKKDKDVSTIKNKSYLSEITKGKQNVNAEQGSALGALILNGNYNWNTEFEEKAVSLDNKNTIQIDKNTVIKLLSPDIHKLTKLKQRWSRELYKKGYNISKNDSNYDDAFEFLIAQEKEKKIFKKKNISKGSINIEELSQIEFSEDTSESNGSSISFVIESYGKKLLFLADSHPSLISKSLKHHYPNVESPIYFDVIKLSHHGSATGTNKELLELIDSEKYIFSTDGSKFGHPNIETIAKIINRKSNFTRNLYFNYKLDIIDEINKTDLKDKYAFKVYYPIENTPLEIKMK